MSALSLPSRSALMRWNMLRIPTGSLRLLSMLPNTTATQSLRFEPLSVFKNGALFDELGLSPVLLQALKKCNINAATHVQAESFNPVMTIRDVVIGGETGSGKTLAYIIPILQKYLASEDLGISRKFSSTIILAPNKDLCRQVVNMTKGLFNELRVAGKDISMEFVGNQTTQWPFLGNSPDFLVTTPAILVGYLNSRSIDTTALLSHVRHLVLDEADMLLDGSSAADMEKLYSAVNAVRKQLIHEGRLLMNRSLFQTVLAAATMPSAGKKSVQMFVKKQFPRAVYVKTYNMHRHHPCIEQEFLPFGANTSPLSPERVEAVLGSIERVLQRDAERLSASAGESSGPIASRDWQQIKGDYAKLDNVLHCYGHSVMIFVNTAQTALALASLLRTTYGVQCGEYHTAVSSISKAAHLRAFQEGSCRVLVCTDSASRGFDMPHVRHVVQAEFAQNVVMHMHRVGRASRAGRQGYATNVYDDAGRDLVHSILREKQDLSSVEVEGDGLQEGERGASGVSGTTATGEDRANSIEKSFSRRRGFRNKLKKKARTQRQKESRREGRLAGDADQGDEDSEDYEEDDNNDREESADKREQR